MVQLVRTGTCGNQRSEKTWVQVPEGQNSAARAEGTAPESELPGPADRVVAVRTDKGSELAREHDTWQGRGIMTAP